MYVYIYDSKSTYILFKILYYTVFDAKNVFQVCSKLREWEKGVIGSPVFLANKFWGIFSFLITKGEVKKERQRRTYLHAYRSSNSNSSKVK